MKDRLITEKHNHKISVEVVEKVRSSAIQNGLYYIVSPAKCEQYGHKDLTLLEVPSEQTPYFQPFLQDGNKIAVDMERVLPFVTESPQVGLEPEQRQKLETGLINLINIAQTAMKDPRIRALFRNNLSQKDLEILEMDYYDPQVDYLSSGSLLRADLLLTAKGKLKTCDPNLVPLGYSIVATCAKNVEEMTGLPVSPSEDYIEGIAVMAAKHPGQISGIVSTLNYPNWSSHAVLAETIRRTSNLPFYLIPHFCLDQEGRIDMAQLNKFNQAFGIGSVEPSNDVPGVLIRYCREIQTFHPETEVINAAGIRLLETQLWKGLIHLPGFERLLLEKGVTQEMINSAREVSVPTLILKVSGEDLLVASNLTTDSNSVLELSWENLENRQDLLVACLWDIDCREKPNELTWFIKTLSTSGKKGVRFTNDGRPDQTGRNIKKVASKMALPENSIFLVQPKIRSTIWNPEGEEMRTKIDLFLSFHTGKTVLVDYMATPIDQRAAHGGSNTGLGLILS